MKKILVLGLILAVAGGAFAQISFTGNIEGGFQVRIPDTDYLRRAQDVNTAFFHTGNYSGARVNLNASGSIADGNAGYVFGLRFNGITSDGTVTPNVTNAYAWYDFMDGMIRLVAAGRGGPGGFGLGGAYNASFDVAAGNNHLSFIVKPVDDLAIGFTLRSGTNGSGRWDAARYGVGVTYTLTDVARFAGLFEYDNEFINIGAGVRILALADAGFSNLGVDFQLHDVGQRQHFLSPVPGSVNESIEISVLRTSQAATWVNEALTVGIDLRQQFLVGDGTFKDIETPVLRFGGFVSYELANGMVPRLDFMLGTGAVHNAAGLREGAPASPAWWRKPGDFVRGDVGLTNIARANGVGAINAAGTDVSNSQPALTRDENLMLAYSRLDKDAVILGINPNLTIPLGGASFEFGVLLNFDLTKNLPSNAIDAQQAIYFNYTLSF